MEANAFFLVDQDGTRRAELSMTHGVPGLTIYGTRKEKVWLAAGKNGSILSLEEPDGKASASLDVGGGSSLTLTDDKGTVALRVYKASPSLWMDGVDGTASLNTVGSGPALSLDGVKGQHSFLNTIGSARSCKGRWPRPRGHRQPRLPLRFGRYEDRKYRDWRATSNVCGRIDHVRQRGQGHLVSAVNLQKAYQHTFRTLPKTIVG